MDTFKQFSNEAEALAHRAETGCGGWIFAGQDGAWIMPADWTPTRIMQWSRGSGRLIP